MSTAVVARDMVSIVDAFAATERGKRAKYSSLVNYWGISYGSYIGETFASLYPDRVGRVALDGMIPFSIMISILTVNQALQILATILLVDRSQISTMMMP